MKIEKKDLGMVSSNADVKRGKLVVDVSKKVRETLRACELAAHTW